MSSKSMPTVFPPSTFCSSHVDDEVVSSCYASCKDLYSGTFIPCEVFFTMSRVIAISNFKSYSSSTLFIGSIIDSLHTKLLYSIRLKEIEKVYEHALVGRILAPHYLWIFVTSYGTEHTFTNATMRFIKEFNKTQNRL